VVGVDAAVPPPPAMYETGDNGAVKDYRFDADGRLLAGTTVDGRTAAEKLNDLLTKLFLPDGYPNSVTSEYLRFSQWVRCGTRLAV